MVTALTAILVLTFLLVLTLLRQHLRSRDSAATRRPGPGLSRATTERPAMTHDLIGADAQPGFGWTALDDYQLNRLLRDSSA